jgi:hypothetical protein
VHNIYKCEKVKDNNCIEKNVPHLYDCIIRQEIYEVTHAPHSYCLSMSDTLIEVHFKNVMIQPSNEVTHAPSLYLKAYKYYICYYIGKTTTIVASQ